MLGFPVSRMCMTAYLIRPKQIRQLNKGQKILYQIFSLTLKIDKIIFGYETRNKSVHFFVPPPSGFVATRRGFLPHAAPRARRSPSLSRAEVSLLVSPRGIEPLSQPSQGYALSVELWGQMGRFVTQYVKIRNCGRSDPTGCLCAALPAKSRKAPRGCDWDACRQAARADMPSSCGQLPETAPAPLLPQKSQTILYRGSHETLGRQICLSDSRRSVSRAACVWHTSRSR